MTNLLTTAELAAERLRHREAVNNLAESLADVVRELAAERALADELADAISRVPELVVRTADYAVQPRAETRTRRDQLAQEIDRTMARYRAARGA